MRLYYMTEEKWARKIISEQRFKLSTFDDLNDPFELLGALVGGTLTRRLHNVLIAHWKENLTMLCTGASWSSPVMWAHYGHKHRGICLGIDVVNGEWLHRVRYEGKKLEGMFEGLSQARMSLDEATSVLTTKFKDWEYEREWRLFASRTTPCQEDGKYYLDFEPHIILREVILGARCDTPVSAIAALIKNPKNSVKVFKARPAFNSFSMVKQKRIKTVTVRPEEAKEEGSRRR